MKATSKAIDKAKLKSEIKRNFDLCIKHVVCPKCAEDLEVGKIYIPSLNLPVYPVRELKCTNKKCDFTHEDIMKN